MPNFKSSTKPHRAEHEVVGADRASFVEACEYSDGTRALPAIMLDMRDGKIARQFTAQAWDE